MSPGAPPDPATSSIHPINPGGTLWTTAPHLSTAPARPFCVSLEAYELQRFSEIHQLVDKIDANYGAAHRE
jgi:hypothetical protein